MSLARLRLALATLMALIAITACGGGAPPDEGPLPEQEQRSEEAAEGESDAPSESES